MTAVVEKILIKCYYSTTAPYLIHITEMIRKNSVLYINRKLILYDDVNYVHVKSISFSDSQKKEIGEATSVKPLWESENLNELSETNTVIQTIATVSDLTKEALTNFTELDIPSSTPADPQVNNYT
ncbi:8497_t:CDS:2 [Scutellospora calospora]|uniref:8497_t:CDS:1 n=1 Tax=Scutellospora calospora TaxID=85575 RepID=A0ACA9KAI3_9GLOM|nr:8497_t:CDS:2 [Scutellospora calospora]